MVIGNCEGSETHHCLFRSVSRAEVFFGVAVVCLVTDPGIPCFETTIIGAWNDYVVCIYRLSYAPA